MADTKLSILGATVAPGGAEIVKAGAVTTLIGWEESIIPMSTLRNADGSDAMVNLQSIAQSNAKMQPNETGAYFAAYSVVPTTLTTGINYFSIRNTDATKKIKIKKIEIVAFFTGTAAASRSLYLLQVGTDCTATTGTTTLIPQKGATTNATSIADIKTSPTGCTLTGAIFTTNQHVGSIGHANQLSANIVHDRNLDDAPLILGQNEVLALRSNGTIVAGSTIQISIKWVEE